MATLTFVLSRIRGHARVIVEVREGAVISRRRQATEYLCFECLVLGAPAEEMPVITSRIRGVCSTAHHAAAVRALEEICGVTPPSLVL